MKILLADDDSSVRRVLQFKLEKKGFKVDTAADGLQALEAIKSAPYDLLLSDIRMPKMDGIELLNEAKTAQPAIKVILITAHATVNQAVQAVKLGAFDYITKPFEDEELFVAIEKALQFEKLESENKRLRGKLKKVESDKKLIGASKPFRQLKSMIHKIADTDATILVTGESGTGKEVVARTIHQESARAEQEFIAVNCAAIPRELIESELFGHTKGAFTGAVRDKKGKFELADKGTLLLDEVSELAIDLQAKLLRVLQENVIEAVGAEVLRPIDVRLIAASNVDLRARVRSGKFREDLFYRLNVVPLQVPSLRERRDDIPLLAREFVLKYSEQDEISLDPKLVDKLMEHDWPGNVRELENLIARMAILRRGNKLTAKDLPKDFGQFDPRDEGHDSDGENQVTLEEAERRMIVEALEKTGWNKTKAAKRLDIPRHVLIYRLKKFEIENPE
ncbi:MAG: sigma-54 dependent transcriptional regulator [candidate division Zixibacteria bacterium]|jgi:two-component system NtrC family response regulator|nr:sigma-54 dependent transcriptional regulator [candidate division Zixibacteria bacterium]